MTRALIVAVSENGVIGRQGGLPWSLPADLRFFKRVTMGHTLIMGRKTFESIGRTLPGRRSIVLTRDPTFRAEGAVAVGDLGAAFAAAEGDDEVFIAGGASVYRDALPHVDRVYLTRVHDVVPGDVHFPELDDHEWRLVASEAHETDDRHPVAFTFERYERRSPRISPVENAQKPIA